MQMDKDLRAACLAKLVAQTLVAESDDDESNNNGSLAASGGKDE